MKATLKYNLEEPDDKMALKRAIYSDGLAIAVWDFLYNGHREYKHSDPNNLSEGFIKAQDKLKELLDDNNINIDELTC